MPLATYLLNPYCIFNNLRIAFLFLIYILLNIYKY
nr:MAG TPA: hypothetical protein [Caudoviricetes sp.]